MAQCSMHSTRSACRCTQQPRQLQCVLCARPPLANLEPWSTRHSHCEGSRLSEAPMSLWVATCRSWAPPTRTFSNMSQRGAYAPLGRGLFGGLSAVRAQLQSEHDLRRLLPRFSEENLNHNAQLLPTIEGIANKLNCTMSQVALAWLLSRGQFIHAIPGSRRPEHIRDNVASSQLQIGADDLALLSETFAASNVAGLRYPEPLLATVNS